MIKVNGRAIPMQVDTDRSVCVFHTTLRKQKIRPKKSYGGQISKSTYASAEGEGTL